MNAEKKRILDIEPNSTNFLCRNFSRLPFLQWVMESDTLVKINKIPLFLSKNDFEKRCRDKKLMEFEAKYQDVFIFVMTLFLYDLFAPPFSLECGLQDDKPGTETTDVKIFVHSTTWIIKTLM